jgi:hypothetical protein
VSDPLPPFEIAVSLNPRVEAVAVATAPTQPAANATVRQVAARYVERHGATITGERVDKRGYLLLRLTLPGEEQAAITVLARAGATRLDR